MKYTFLSVFLINLLFFSASAQDNAINGSKTVDHFTGAFTYSVPLISVPSKNGPSINISTSYRSGIKTNQNASIVGLGWNISFGEITRQVNGFPDDWKGSKVTTKTSSSTTPIIKDVNVYGPLYYKDFDYSDADAKMDIKQEFIDNAIAPIPNFDNFYVNAAGISGEVMAPLLDYSTLITDDVISKEQLIAEKLIDFSNPHDDATGGYSGGGKKFTSKPEFTYFNSNNAKVYHSASLESEVNEVGLSQNWVIPPANVTEPSSVNAKSSRFIKYYTNAELASASPSGFLEASSLHLTLTRSAMPDDGIGAFQITNENNFTYHFSLPVYVRSDKSLSVELNSKKEPIAIGEKIYTDFDEVYAISWKLTAVTGPNYSDINNNGLADEGDFGYWVAYDYSYDDWDYKVNIPSYGLNLFSNKIQTEKNMYRKEYYDFKSIGSNKQIQMDKYSLLSIKTNTHYALLKYDTRDDSKSTYETTSNLKKLSEISLYSNEDPPSSLTETNWKLKALQYISFNQDYSLSQKYIFNKNTSYATNNSNSWLSNISTNSFLSQCSSSNEFNIKSVEAVTGATNSGKLTLKGIDFFGKNDSRSVPSYEFEYSNNPEFDLEKYDYFGYYKADKNNNNRRHVNPITAPYTSAWSLTKVTTPLGAEINVAYEPNEYSKVLNAQEEKPTHTFIGTYINPTQTTYDDYEQFYYSNRIDTLIENFNGLPGSLHPDNLKKGISLFDKAFQKITLEKDFGGGPRVKEVKIVEGGNAYKTEFKYSNGVLTKPIGEFWGDAQKGQLINIQALSKESNSPTIGYGLVEVINVSSDGKTNGKTLYKFSTSYNLSGSSNTSMTTKPYPNGNGQTAQYPDKISTRFLRHKSQFFGKLQQVQKINANNSVVEEYKYGYTLITVIKDDYYSSNKTSFDPTKTTETRFSIPPIYKCFNGNGPDDFTLGSPGYGALSEDESFFRGQNTVQIWGQDYGSDRYDFGWIDSDGVPHYNINTYHLLQNNGVLDLSDEEYATMMRINPSAVQFLDKGIGNCILMKPGLNGNHTPPRNVPIENSLLIYYSISIPILEEVEHFKNGIRTSTFMSGYTAQSFTPTQKVVKDETGMNIKEKITPFNSAKSINSLAPNVIDKPETIETYSHDELVSKVKNERKTTANVRDVNANLIPKTILKEYLSPYVYAQKTWDLENDLWITTQESTLLNSNLNVLEQKTFRDQYSAVKYGYDSKFPIASINNANYLEFTYSGFEDNKNAQNYFESEVFTTNTPISNAGTVAPHSGEYMISLATNEYVAYTVKSTQVGLKGYYRTSFWVHKDEVSDINNLNIIASASFPVTATSSNFVVDNKVITENGDWYLVKADVFIDPSVVGNSHFNFKLEVKNLASNNVYIDDFRFQPVDSEMSASVYDKKTGQVLYVFDNENYYSRYEYGDDGSVYKIYKETKEGEVLIQENSKNFKR